MSLYQVKRDFWCAHNARVVKEGEMVDIPDGVVGQDYLPNLKRKNLVAVQSMEGLDDEHYVTKVEDVPVRRVRPETKEEEVSSPLGKLLGKAKDVAKKENEANKE